MIESISFHLMRSFITLICAVAFLSSCVTVNISHSYNTQPLIWNGTVEFLDGKLSGQVVYVELTGVNESFFNRRQPIPMKLSEFYHFNGKVR